MAYKETLFFIAKCLTLFWEDKNRILIQKTLETGCVDWEAVVKVSTSHYVFPALYFNLKRVDFLEYVPKDLVAYMEHITNLNRHRNLQILDQAKELNQLLLDNHISPIFIKGTGNLFEELYGDPAERMVGDIDFIVSKQDYSKTFKVLLHNEYEIITKQKYFLPSFRHQLRLKKKGFIAAVEIHKELTTEKYAHEFNYKYIHKEIQKINEASVLSYEHQLVLSIVAKQINDNGFQFKNIALRNAYDLFLLSKKAEASTAISNFISLKNPLNCFLAICYVTLGEIDSLKYDQTKRTISYLKTYNDLLSSKQKRDSKVKTIERQVFIKKRVMVLFRSIFDKEYRDWLLKRISDPSWQSQKLQQLGLKKRK